MVMIILGSPTTALTITYIILHLPLINQQLYNNFPAATLITFSQEEMKEK